LISGVWDSPVATTWFAIVARLSSFGVILPFVLWRFDAPTAAVWLLFMSIAGLQALADAGFGPTFVRLFGHAVGGASLSELQPGRLNPVAREASNEQSITMVLSAVNLSAATIYRRLAIATALVLVMLGTWVIRKPVAAIGSPTDAWIAWLIVVVSTTTTLFGVRYSSFLQGIGQVALLRRWESLVHLIGLASGLTVVACDGGLLALVLSTQVPIIAGVLWSARLCSTFSVFRAEARAEDVSRIVRYAWSAAWRSGLGIVAGFGTIQITGILYTQVLPPIEAASILLALRIAHVINLLAQPPFYSAIPQLAATWASGDIRSFLEVAKRGMRYSLLILVAAYAFAAFTLPAILSLVGSRTPFLSRGAWLLLAAGYFLERYGAMHLQLYTVNGRVIWHIANGVTGIIFVTANLALYRRFGSTALPLALLIANAAFYSWYCVAQSHRILAVRFVEFEMRIVGPALTAALIFAGMFWLATS
jgi:hypothetical protein